MPFGSLPTSTFSSPRAGRLQITLSAQYYANTYTDAGFPSSGGGSGNLAIKGYAGPTSGAPGSYTYTPIIDRYSGGTATVELDYPGGGAAWDIGVVEQAFKSPGGLYTIGFQNIQLNVRLRKR